MGFFLIQSNKLTIMLQINIGIKEICLNLKINPEQILSREVNPWYLDFYCQRNDQKYRSLKQKIQFRQQIQQIDINHQLYAKNIEQKLGFKILLNRKDLKANKINFKYLGKCELQLKEFINSDDQYPIVIQYILPLKDTPDSSAYIKVQIKIEQMKQFTDYYKIKDKSIKQIKLAAYDSDDQFIEQSINRKTKIQQAELSKFELQRLKDRSQRYQQQIRHLKNENRDLIQQISQRKEAIGLFSKIEADKVEILNKKNINIQRQFIKSKQRISHIVNLINEYGRPDIVEKITNLLAS